MSDIAVAKSGTRLQNFLDRAGLSGFPWITATVLYTISWGWLFIVRDSMWWDDYALLNKDLKRFVLDSGFVPWLRIYISLFEFLGPGFFRMVIFISFFICGLCVYAISKKTNLGKRLLFGNEKLLTLLFILLPFNTTRVSLSVFNYSLAIFFFFVGWYLIVISNWRVSFLTSQLFFFLSFQMPSIIPFFILPMIHYLHESQFLRQKEFRNSDLRLRLGSLALLPFVFLILRSNFWPNKTGIYQFKLNKVDDAFLLVLISSAVFALLLWRVNLREKRDLLLISLGVCSLSYALFAFVATNQIGERFWYKIPMMMLGRSGWFGRHLILMPLGTAMLICGFAMLIERRYSFLSKVLISLIVLFSVLFNVGFGFEYTVDYQKRIAISETLKDASWHEISKWTFLDETPLLNARGRFYYLHDWVGILYESKLFDLKNADFDIVKKSGLVADSCQVDYLLSPKSRAVLIQGPETHWQAFKNWVSDGDMGFRVTVDDTPGACKPEMVNSERVSGAIPILFYFTGAKG